MSSPHLSLSVTIDDPHRFPPNSLRYLVVVSSKLPPSLPGNRLPIVVFAAGSKSDEIPLIGIEASSNLGSLARDKEIDTIVLVDQFIEERFLKIRQRSIDMPGDRNRLAVVFRGVDLDLVLQFVIIDVVWWKIQHK